MSVLPDLLIDPLSLIAYTSVLWILLGVVAGAIALTVILIVVLARKKKEKENRGESK